MKLHQPHDCACGHPHSASGPGSPSTNYFVLGLSILLVMCGLLRFWW